MRFITQFCVALTTVNWAPLTVGGAAFTVGGACLEFTVRGAPKQGRGTPLMILGTIFWGGHSNVLSVSNYLTKRNGT